MVAAGDSGSGLCIGLEGAGVEAEASAGDSGSGSRTGVEGTGAESVTAIVPAAAGNKPGYSLTIVFNFFNIAPLLSFFLGVCLKTPTRMAMIALLVKAFFLVSFRRYVLIATGKRDDVSWIITAQTTPSVLTPVVIVVA